MQLPAGCPRPISQVVLHLKLTVGVDHCDPNGGKVTFIYKTWQICGFILSSILTNSFFKKHTLPNKNTI